MKKQPTMATMIATVPIRITVPMGISRCLWGEDEYLYSHV